MQRKQNNTKTQKKTHTFVTSSKLIAYFIQLDNKND